MKKHYLVLLSIALAFVSCSQDMETPENDGQEIRLTSFIQPQAQTRGANLEEQSTLINNGQSVGVTITGASAVHQNVEWTSDGSGNLTNTGAPIYYKGTSEANITAYHPFNAEWTDLAATYTFNVAADQSGEGYANSDLLYATQAASSTALTTNLAFSHKMAKIGVSLTVSDGSDLSAAEISITNTSTEATVNLSSNGVATCTGNFVSSIKAGEGGTAAAIIVPQTVGAGTKLISVSFNGSVYTYSLPAEKNFEAGKSYLYRLRINNKELTLEGSEVNDWDKEETEGDMEKEEPIPYVTFHSELATALRCDDGLFLNMEYSVAEGDWSPVTEIEKPIVFGGEYGDLRLRAISPYGSKENGEPDCSPCRFVFVREDCPVECSGDIRTLVDYTHYATADTRNASFVNLFSGCPITSAPTLPATALAPSCYKSMFSGCSLLKEAPKLPSTILTEECYDSMFLNCISLAKVPNLPAEILTKACYSSMFWGCESLVDAPIISAKSVAENSCNSMFQGCKMLENAPELPAMVLAKGCYAHMFENCWNLTTAPELPAENLVETCYMFMFTNCHNISTVKMMATDISAERCITVWLYGVASTGNFIKSASLNKTSQELGVPSGWTVVNE